MTRAAGKTRMNIGRQTARSRAGSRAHLQPGAFWATCLRLLFWTAEVRRYSVWRLTADEPCMERSVPTVLHRHPRRWLAGPRRRSANPGSIKSTAIDWDCFHWPHWSGPMRLHAWLRVEIVISHTVIQQSCCVWKQRPSAELNWKHISLSQNELNNNWPLN
jgi:hypothetical protein